MPRNRVLTGAKVRCGTGTCRILKIQVRYVVNNRVFNGIGRGPNRVAQGRTVVLRSTMPVGLYRKLRRGRVSGTVTSIVTARSATGTRLTDSIRTGLKR